MVCEGVCILPVSLPVFPQLRSCSVFASLFLSSLLLHENVLAVVITQARPASSALRAEQPLRLVTCCSCPLLSAFVSLQQVHALLDQLSLTVGLAGAVSVQWVWWLAILLVRTQPGYGEVPLSPQKRPPARETGQSFTQLEVRLRVIAWFLTLLPLSAPACASAGGSQLGELLLPPARLLRDDAGRDGGDGEAGVRQHAQIHPGDPAAARAAAVRAGGRRWPRGEGHNERRTTSLAGSSGRPGRAGAPECAAFA